jgi:DNA-binding phage protein
MPIGSNFDDFLKGQGMFEQCTIAAMKGALQTVPFDAADYLDNEATIAVYFSLALSDLDPNVLLRAVNDIERAPELSKLTKIG